MPIFVYEPVAPEGRACCFFEVLQWSSEAPLEACPNCGQAVRRAVTEFAAQTRSGAGKADAAVSQAGTTETARSGREQSSGLISGASDSAATRAARLAYRHVCGKNCRH